MKKILIALAIFFLIVSLGIIFWKINQKEQKKTIPIPSPQASTSNPNKISDETLKNALNAYAQAKQKGTDLTSGPCMGIIAPDWVADIAHNPRQAIDDKPENQCADFREGRAHHFIELDQDGKLIRSQ